MNTKTTLALASLALIAVIVGGVAFVVAQSNNVQLHKSNGYPCLADLPSDQDGQWYGRCLPQNLTDAQREEIALMVQELKNSGATTNEIHSAIIAKLQSWGIETPSMPSQCQNNGTGMMGGNGKSMMGDSGISMMGGYRSGNGPRSGGFGGHSPTS